MRGAGEIRARVAGIDGSRSGWIACTQTAGTWSINFFPDFAMLVEVIMADLTFLDMPVGLSGDGFHRIVDALARKELTPGKTSSVFTPPCREAACAETYEQALDLNRLLTGKGISIQAWNISRKITEVERTLLSNMSMVSGIYEAHPEICFKHLNDGVPIISSKRTSEGYHERLAVLDRYDLELCAVVKAAIETVPRTQAARDDIVDAAALALSAHFANTGGIRLVGGHQALDRKGLPVRIAFGTPFRHQSASIPM